MNVTNFIMTTKPDMIIKHLYFNTITEQLIVTFENSEEQEVSYCHLQK